MARGINKIFLLGHLGADPEMRYTSDGKAVANVNLATSDSWNDKNTGEHRERTEWHKVVFFSPLAEEAGEVLRKGSQIYIEGAIRTRKWQDQSGQDRYTTEVVAKQLCPADFVGTASDSASKPEPETSNVPNDSFGGLGDDPF